VAVSLLDNVIDVSRFPLPQQAENARGSRRVGLGITGLADALVMLGPDYDSAGARATAADFMRLVCHSAYRASIELAREKGRFPHSSGTSISTLRSCESCRRTSEWGLPPAASAQSPDCHCPDRDDQPARRQCLERNRADLRRLLRAQPP
jgi:ribonucleotide reductase alpha subunit